MLRVNYAPSWPPASQQRKDAALDKARERGLHMGEPNRLLRASGASKQLVRASCSLV